MFHTLTKGEGQGNLWVRRAKKEMAEPQDSCSAEDDPLARLIKAAQAGSQEAMAELVETCRTYLLMVANRELPIGLQGKIAPSDLVQETVVEACRDFSQFGGRSQHELLGWLRRILLNNVTDSYRRYEQTAKRQASREVPLATLGGDRIDLAGEQTSPSHAAMAQEEQNLLSLAIESLSEVHRQVILLHHSEGLSFQEISRRVNRSAEAVRKLWLRAVKNLQKELEALDGD